MRILAIDPSSTATGFAVMELRDNAPFIVKSGALSHPKPSKASFEEKCIFIIQTINSELYYWLPDLVVIEYPHANSRNLQSSIKIARLSGMIEAICSMIDVNYIMIPPAQWKKAFTGNGNAKKELVQEYVELYYGIKIKTNDESDALAIGTYYLNFYLEEIQNNER